jgi:hypothetical protein
MLPRALSAVAVVAVVLASLWYVIAPPRGVDSYRERASITTGTLRSQVQTARIWLRTLARDDTLRTSAGVGLREADEDASAAAASFEGYDPPRGTDALRARLSTLAEETTTVLGDLRIAAQRDEWDRLDEIGQPLPALAGRLDALARRAQP